MTANIAAYPLQWPDMLPRAIKHEKSAFKTTRAGALNNVQRSLVRFGNDSGKPVSAIVLSSNCSLGIERPQDPGVAAWFSWEGEQLCIAVDRYATPAENLQAIHHVLEARRTELRHGTLALVRATFRGFRALPAPAGKKRWDEILGFERGQTVTLASAKAAYRRLAAENHPDRGGSTASMADLNRAWEEAQAALS